MVTKHSQQKLLLPQSFSKENENMKFPKKETMWDNFLWKVFDVSKKFKFFKEGINQQETSF